jgi:GxxExxY protein
MEEFIFKEECYQIIGCAMEVHNVLGSGFLESVYHEALTLEFEDKDVFYESEKILTIYYKGRKLTKKFTADFVCYDEIIVELKAVETILPEHISQVLNYLKATGCKVGLLINFGQPSLQYKRIIL